MLTSAKSKKVLVLEGMFSETTYVWVLMCQIQVSSITLTSFRLGEGVILSPPHTPQNEPLKSPPRLGLSSKFEV